MKLMTTLLFAILAVPTFAGAATWNIDPDHSNAQFKVQHMVITYVRGNFPDVQGTVVLDDQDITKSKVDVSITAASLDTNVEKRDNHLKSPDFFDVEKYPALTFKSKSVESNGNGELKVLGDLTIRGITREVELQVSGPTQSITDPWGNTRKGAQATAKVNRKDFGMTWNKTLDTGGLVVGDDVEISIEVELIEQKG
ncbi:polyisoprenoid-binding protein [Desulfuromonas versatilis]|uniref:Polyisoprenoid-binding protein n=1 Tax=Desulfuromonas versatilis TaxID=2802975 RepID=A0ABM8HNF0_9BACT|nr:YceI family protein [Desulfuromonas versatilis]BCR04348.1 polyisoprenoid-binding protein [Desulfuromonas versatilis]